MNAYKIYKNRLEKFLQTERGKRFINFAYSIGAAVVILGAMFKLLHFPFGNELLFIGMITEVIVFTLSAFDTPIRDYNWDRVFPSLTSEKPVEKSVLNSALNTGLNSQQDVNGIHAFQEQKQTDYSQQKQPTSMLNLPSNNIDLAPQTEKYSQQLENLTAETEKMAKQIQELNEVYARMLKAMSVNRDN